MDGEDVLRYGRSIPCFLGVFELDDLLKLNVVKVEVGLIVIYNEHAIALYFTEDQVEIFDALGLENKNVLQTVCQFLKVHLPCKRLRLNTKIQSSGSQKCAYFCLVYLFFRCRSYTFDHILNLFSCDLKTNDERVSRLFKLHFR